MNAAVKVAIKQLVEDRKRPKPVCYDGDTGSLYTGRHGGSCEPRERGIVAAKRWWDCLAVPMIVLDLIYAVNGFMVALELVQA